MPGSQSRLALAAISAGTLAIAGLFIAPLGVQSAYAADSFSFVPQSDTLPGGTAAVSGQVLGGTASSPAPMPGVQILLIVWPSDASLAAAADGTSLSGALLSQDTTDANGRYSLAASSLSHLNTYATPAGMLNFEVYVPSNPDLSAIFSRRLSTSTSGSMFAAPDPDSESDGGAQTQAVGANVPALVNLGSGTPTPSADSLATSGLIEAGTPDPVPTDGSDDRIICAPQFKTVKTYPKRIDVVGQYFSGYASATGKFNYHTGATSSLGVGVSATGAFGSFHIEGKTSIDSDATQTYPTSTGKGGWLYQSFFKVKKIHETCANGLINHWFVKVVEWDGGAPQNGISTAGLPSGTYKCVPEPSGGGLTKSTSKAITWTDGLSMSKYIGLDLSSSTGYSTSASQTVTFQKSGHLCGRGDFPAGTPYILDSRS